MTGCPRCPEGTPYRATGDVTPIILSKRRAEFVCEACGHIWSSGLPEAIALGEQVFRAQGNRVWRPGAPPLTPPQPNLPGAAEPPARQDTVTANELKRYVHGNRMRRARKWYATGGRMSER